MQEKNKYSCDEHMDIAFDDFLIENETFPCLKEAEGKKCSYCGKNAVYVLSVEHMDKG